MKSKFFHVNLKKAIKDNGFDVLSFPPQYLGCTYQAFNWRLKYGKFHLEDIITCIEVLGVDLNSLLKQVPIKTLKKKPKKDVKPIEPTDFSKLHDLLNN
jgi:hypothetical protein